MILNYFDANNIKPAIIAREINVDKSTFSKWKSKPTSKIDLDIVMKISNYINVPINDLLNRVESNQHSYYSSNDCTNVTFCNLKEFLNYFEFGGKYYPQLSDFIFRGQSTDSYELLPTALRSPKNNNQNDINQNYKDNLLSLSIDNCQYESGQVIYEFLLLRNFYQTANKNGLKLPYVKDLDNKFLYSSYNVELFRNIIESTSGLWISSEFEELAALAQHYGIPTRLMDWTFDFKVALYFASSNACKESLKRNYQNYNDYMVIWAINTREVANIFDAPLKFITPNYYRNENLMAQKGVLSYWQSRTESNLPKSNLPNYINFKKVDREPLPKKLYKYSQKQNVDVSKILYKFLIPISECAETFEYLMKNNYSAATMFPGYDSIKKAFDEIVILDKLIYNSDTLMAASGTDKGVNKEKYSENERKKIDEAEDITNI